MGTCGKVRDSAHFRHQKPEPDQCDPPSGRKTWREWREGLEVAYTTIRVLMRSRKQFGQLEVLEGEWKRRRHEEWALEAAGFPPGLEGKERESALVVAYEARKERNRATKAPVKRLHAARRYEACPPWVDRAEVAAIYSEAKRLTRETGIPHEVDHIVPLLGAGVSGLHVPWNLRPIPRSANRRKSNKVLALVAALLLPVSAMANHIVVAICVAGYPSGDFTCSDTMFASQEYVDCVDDPAMPAIGSPDRGSGFIRWGNTVNGEFVADGQALYDFSGWQVISGPVVRAVVGVDEDRLFADGLDRQCRRGWF